MKIKKLIGRAANGYELGKGALYHSIHDDDEIAICGAKPGKKSAGWSFYEGENITCKKCLDLMQKIKDK